MSNYYRKQLKLKKIFSCFLNGIPTPQLTAEEASECEGPSTKQDIYKCLQDMGNGKGPGNGGYLKSFIYFLDFISEDLIQCYDCCLEEENVSCQITGPEQNVLIRNRHIGDTVRLI